MRNRSLSLLLPGLALATAALGAACTFTPPNVDPPCASQCTVGAGRCAGLLVEACGDVNGDGCTEFAAPLPCPGGSCSLGLCGPPADCADDCLMNGVAGCSGDSVQICGEFDSDDCLDLGPATNCAGTDTCSSGLCSPSCLDECLMGTVVCIGLAGQRVCGEWDGDPCLDLSAPMMCPAGQFCGISMVGLMACQTCTDECDPSTYLPECSPDEFTECVSDADIDPCFEVIPGDCSDCLMRPSTDPCLTCCEMCGDFNCTVSETTCSCAIDCGSVCGDGCCTGSETISNCCNDCPCTPPTTCTGPMGSCF